MKSIEEIRIITDLEHILAKAEALESPPIAIEAQNLVHGIQTIWSVLNCSLPEAQDILDVLSNSSE